MLELGNQGGVEPELVGQVLPPDLGLEHQVELIGHLVADGDHDIGVVHVVDQRDVFVADALDVVLAKAVLEHRRTLERFDSHDLGAELRLEVVACSNRSGRTGSRDEAARAEGRPPHRRHGE